MHDDIKTIRPILFLVNAEPMFFGVGITFVNYGPGHIGARADPFREDFFLGIVIMATSAGNEESAQRFGCFRAIGNNNGRPGADSEENAEYETSKLSARLVWISNHVHKLLRTSINCRRRP